MSEAARPASASAPAPAVAVEALTKRFGEFVAVDDVGFEVAPGEVFGFLGPNGAGKTTTIKMLNGLLAPTSGVDPISRRRFWDLIYGVDNFAKLTNAA